MSGTNGAANAGDPSMDEILSSIRRILNDGDGDNKAAMTVPSPAPAPSQPANPNQANIDSLFDNISAPQPDPQPVLTQPKSQAQTDIDSMFDSPAVLPPIRVTEPLDLTEEMLVSESTDVPAAKLPDFPDMDMPFSPPPLNNPPPPRRTPPPPMAPSIEMPDFMGSDDQSLISSSTAHDAANSVKDLLRGFTDDSPRHGMGSGMPVYRSGGPTIEDLIRDELRPMLRSWLDSNLAPLIRDLVREELRSVISQAKRGQHY